MANSFSIGRVKRYRAIAVVSLAIAGAIGAMPPPSQALPPGQIVIVDETLPGVFLVDAASGDRQLISSATVGTGPNFSRPTAVVIESDDSLLVGDANLESVFRVNVLSGDRSVLTNGFNQFVGLALESDGDIVATDFGLDSVLRVDPVSGSITTVSSASVGSGPVFGDVPVGIAVETSGSILVSEQELAAIFRVDPVTGNRTIVSSASVGSGVPLSNPGKIVLEPDGSILVADAGVIRRVNPVTGDRELLASPSALSEFDIEEGGDIVFTVSAPSSGAVIRIDQPSGVETVVSSNVVGSGPHFVHTFGIIAARFPAPTSTPTETPTITATPLPTRPPTETPTNTPTDSPTFAAGCPSVPDNTCFSAGKSTVLFKDHTDANKHTFSWKWSKGVLELVQGDFGNPASGTTSYKLCVYDQTASAPVFKMGATVAPGGTCGTKPCWKALSTKGWGYTNRAGNADDITKVTLRGGDAGKPQAQVKGKGATLPLPAAISGMEFFDQDPAVIVQLHSSSPAACWSSTFGTSNTKKNTALQFKATTR